MTNIVTLPNKTPHEDNRGWLSRFLFPQYSIEEAIIASIFLLIGSLIVLDRGNYTIEFLFLGAAIVAGMSLVFSLALALGIIRPGIVLLRVVQIIATVETLAISAFYAFTVAVMPGDGSWVDRLLLVYAGIVALRIVVVQYLTEEIVLTALLKTMVPARALRSHLLVISLAVAIGLYLFYTEIDIVSLAMGKGYFISVAIIDIAVLIIGSINSVRHRSVL